VVISAGEARDDDGLDRVHSVLGLLEDVAGRRGEDVVGDLGPAEAVPVEHPPAELASRAYTYGPPEPGSRAFSERKVRARAIAPTVTSPKATSEIGPYAASADGSAKTPVPITEPTTSAEADGSPNLPRVEAGALVAVMAGPSGGEVAVTPRSASRAPPCPDYRALRARDHTCLATGPVAS
jgi:hypothetical protein